MTREWQGIGPTGAFYECPRWHDGSWWVSDFHAGRLLRLDEDGTVAETVAFDGEPAGTGWLPDGTLLVVSMGAGTVLRRDRDGQMTVHADIARFCGGPTNDMVVAADGTAYVGNFGFGLNEGEDPRTTGLVAVAPDGEARQVASELWFPNGGAITPDGRTLIVGETFACRMTAFTIGADGSLGERRTWARLAPAPAVGTLAEMVPQAGFAPDGCTLDANLRLWVADSLHGRCCLVAEGGAVIEELTVPAGLSVFACALGGADGRTLLVTAAPDFDPVQRAARHESVLLTTRVEVPGA
jgi:sugar lactone lactonase YvrE